MQSHTCLRPVGCISWHSVHLVSDVPQELLAGGDAVYFRRGLNDPLEILVREFRVDRNQAWTDPDYGVHSVATLKPVLQRVVLSGQDLCEQVAKKEFAHAAAQFWSAHYAD